MHIVFTQRLVRQALLQGDIAGAFADQLLGLRMQHQGHTQRRCRRLTRVVIWRGTDAATRKHHARLVECALQCLGQAHRVIAYIIGMAEAQAAQGQQLNDFAHVFVLALAGEDFIANDDQAEFGCSI